MGHVETIERWFIEHRSGSLVLPDGWYGRPYDNEHALSRLEESGSMMVMELDDKLRFRFEGLECVKAVKAEYWELVFGPFEKLTFEAEAYGSDRILRRAEYSEGLVRIVAPPG